MDDAKIKGRMNVGERNAAAKLTNAQAVDIKRMIADGMSNAEIARHFHITRTSVHGIRVGKKWKRAVWPQSLASKRVA